MTQKLTKPNPFRLFIPQRENTVVISCNEKRYEAFLQEWEARRGSLLFQPLKLEGVQPSRIPKTLQEISTRSYGRELGCLLSHRAVISYADMLGLPYVWILEDDCRLQHFDSYANLAGQVNEDWGQFPDLQVVHLDGWWHEVDSPKVEFFPGGNGNPAPMRVQGPPIPGVPRVYPRLQGHLWCTHSYIVRKDAYKRLLRLIDANLFVCFKWDVLIYADSAPHGVMVPTPCGQCAGFSDIALKTLPEKH